MGGAVDFNTAVTANPKELGEYLSSQSYAVINSSVKYEITIKLMGNYKDYSQKELFLLELIGNGFSIAYSNCSVLKDREYCENGLLYREIVISSEERMIRDE